MIGMQYRTARAVGALTSECGDKQQPLDVCVRAGGLQLPRAPACIRSFPNCAPMWTRVDLLLAALRVTRVIRAVLRTMLVRVLQPPAPHGRTRPLGIALHPIAPVCAPLLRIAVRHAWLVPKS
jgi:hypothetical protein